MKTSWIVKYKKGWQKNIRFYFLQNNMSEDPFSSFNFPSTIYQFLIVPFSEVRRKWKVWLRMKRWMERVMTVTLGIFPSIYFFKLEYFYENFSKYLKLLKSQFQLFPSQFPPAKGKCSVINGIRILSITRLLSHDEERRERRRKKMWDRKKISN